MVNWLDFTCVSTCPNGTYYDEALNECPVCNPVCITCTGSAPNECTSCNKTGNGQQLYLEEDVSECVLNC